MKRQHFRSDLTLHVTITRPANSDGGGGQVAIPDHVRLEYFVPDGRTAIIAERNGKDMTLCKLAEDGMSLEVFLPLSRKTLGTGNLMVVITEFSPLAGFPDNVKEIHNPSETGIQLWKGASDGDSTIATEAELVAWRYGYSAYELAKFHGFEGTEADFIEWLRKPAVDASKEAEAAEGARKLAESNRALAEQVRANAESSRVAAEKGRVSAESSRKDAESARVNAEIGRVTEFGKLKKESETATKNAQDAADIAAVNILAIDVNPETGIITAYIGGDSSAFVSGGVNPETGDIELNFNYN